MSGQREPWHIDKRVPVALLLGMLGQIVFVVWGAAVMFKDIQANRSGLQRLGARVEALDQNANAQAVQLGRIEENIRGVRDDIGRLLNIIEQRYQR